MQFADIGGHGAGQYAYASLPPGHGAQTLADIGGGGGNGNRIHEVNGNTAEMQRAHPTSAARSAADDGARTLRFRQMIGDLGQRVAGTADHDELAGAQQFFWLAPFGDIGEGVYTDEKKQAVVFLQLALEGADGVDGIMELLARIRRFQQRGK